MPSDGEPAFPRTVNLATPEGSGKFSDHSIFYHQYLGRCEFAHSRACWMGSRGGRIARYLRVVGKFSIPLDSSRSAKRKFNLGRRMRQVVTPCKRCSLFMERAMDGVCPCFLSFIGLTEA
jgi:hypothetical protein